MPLKYSQLSPGQRAMVDDGCPIACMPTPKEQAAYKAWCATNPPTVIPAFRLEVRDETAETAAFRAAEEERRRQKSLAGIARMKNRFATKAIDHSKMRWDQRRNKFVEDVARSPAPAPKSASDIRPSAPATKGPTGPAAKPAGAGTLTKDNAETLAKLNGVWKDSYEKLRGTGRIVMTVKNVLNGITKRGGTVKWQ